MGISKRFQKDTAFICTTSPTSPSWSQCWQISMGNSLLFHLYSSAFNTILLAGFEEKNYNKQQEQKGEQRQRLVLNTLYFQTGRKEGERKVFCMRIFPGNLSQEQRNTSKLSPYGCYWHSPGLSIAMEKEDTHHHHVRVVVAATNHRIGGEGELVSKRGAKLWKSHKSLRHTPFVQSYFASYVYIATLECR